MGKSGRGAGGRSRGVREVGDVDSSDDRDPLRNFYLPGLVALVVALGASSMSALYAREDSLNAERRSAYSALAAAAGSCVRIDADTHGQLVSLVGELSDSGSASSRAAIESRINGSPCLPQLQGAFSATVIISSDRMARAAEDLHLSASEYHIALLEERSLLLMEDAIPNYERTWEPDVKAARSKYFESSVDFHNDARDEIERDRLEELVTSTASLLLPLAVAVAIGAGGWWLWRRVGQGGGIRH